MKKTNTGRDEAHHGRKVEQVRWTIRSAAHEFDLDNATITKRLKAAGIIPNPQDNCYSTMDIVNALYGGLKTKIAEAQLQDLKESAGLKKARKGNLLKENIPIDMVEKVWSDFMVDLRQKVNNLDLPPAKRSEILSDLQDLKREDYFKGIVKDDDEAEQEVE